jgi:hypothetical protein
MYARFVLIAAATLVGSVAFAAQPAKPPVQSSTQPQRRPADVVLASADQVREAAPSEQQASAPAKRPRVARVTTCRCGDPEPQPQK